MRLPSFVNWTLLCMNTVLFVFLLLMSPVRPGWLGLERPARRLPSDVAALGLDFYYEKGPFVLLVGKDFPRNESFALIQRGAPANLSLEVLQGLYGPATKSVTVGLGTDSISFDYSNAAGGAKVHHLMFSHRNKGLLETFTDINADGVYDFRQTRDESRHVSHVFVWYHATWREALGRDIDPKQDEYHKALADGTRVSFDMQSGRWLSSAEKSATSRDNPK
jgi:hypothetical protein